MVGKQEASFIPQGDVGHRRPSHFLIVAIVNLHEIELTFGPKARRDAFERLRTEVGKIAKYGQIVEIETAAAIEFMVHRKGSDQLWKPGYLIERLCRLLHSRPVITDGDPFYVVPSVGVVDISSEKINLERAREEAWRQIDAWPIGFSRVQEIGRYREDMKRSARLLERVERGGAVLVWQSIVSREQSANLQYLEGLLRVDDDEGNLRTCEADIRAIERVGLAPELDRRLMSLVVDHLESDPAIRLGVNISANSASFHRYGRDASWCELRWQLERNPELARRLVIEITEAADLVSLDEGCEFVSVMQSLGCLVAVDDFGAGRGSVIQFATLAVDIVKIDGSFVQGATQDGRAFSAFQHLVGLGRAIASSVVVEGVETADQAELARKAGADGLQGYHFSRPSASQEIHNEARMIFALHSFSDRFRPGRRSLSVR